MTANEHDDVGLNDEPVRTAVHETTAALRFRAGMKTAVLARIARERAEAAWRTAFRAATVVGAAAAFVVVANLMLLFVTGSPAPRMNGSPVIARVLPGAAVAYNEGLDR